MNISNIHRVGRLVLLAAGFLACGSARAADDLYEYDAAGRLSKVTYSTGQVVSYTYDDRSNLTAVIQSVLVDVGPAADAPAFVDALLDQRPNPARGEIRLRFSLARPGRATLELFSVAGRRVRTLTDREFLAGEYEAHVTLQGIPAGVYFWRFGTSGFEATRRLVVLE